MASCRIVYASVSQAIEAIAQVSQDLKDAGENFINDLNGAISEMEGATKDALKLFIDTDVRDFVADQLPKAVESMSELLKGNRDNFEKVDADIAASIKGGEA